MYRMLQALERQQIDSPSCDERTNIQSPAPTNYQQRDIYVRIIRFCELLTREIFRL
jgi:hypothetical protein